MIAGGLAFLFTFLLVIGLHETGHALAARYFGVKIEAICLGFGRPLIQWQNKSGLAWVWALWPVGGYVKLLNSRIRPVSGAELMYCLDKKPIGVRCFILLAGAFANLVVAWLALTIMFMAGYKQNPPVIQQVIPQSLASKAGIISGDRLVAIGGQPTPSWQEAGMQLISLLGQAEVQIKLTTPQNEPRQVSLDLSSWHFPEHKGSLFTLLGMEPGLQVEQQWVAGESFFQAGKSALFKTGHLLNFFVTMLKQLVTGVIPFTLLLGPIGFLQISLSSFLQGLSVFMYFIASLSLAVGFVNLWPLPGLDGGSIVYALVEKIRGKPISIAMEILLHRLAVIAFCLFFVQLLLNDLQRYVQ